MSKQVKLKFKKLIKQAEFIHADLEYHDELSVDAKNLFRKAVDLSIKGLSEEEREKLNSLISERERQHQELLEERSRAQEIEAIEGDAQETDMAGGAIEDHPDVELLPEEDHAMSAAGEEKTLELKKLFHKIAALTHPDKASARGLAKEETSRLERIFKQATDAYKEGNWYILYCIATDLSIKIDNISEEHLDWIEDDIRNTLAKIAGVANLVAWGWYTGDAAAKNLALKSYFFQLYGYEWNPS
jgi:cob(I)alamin adenosyltransferase